MDYAECPGCFADLRIPPMNELSGLGTALSESPFVERIE